MRRAEILERVNLARRKLDAVREVTRGTFAGSVVRDVVTVDLRDIPSPDADRARWSWMLTPILVGIACGFAGYGLAVFAMWWLAGCP